MPEVGIRVLVIDDEPAIRRYLTTTLNAHGYQVTLASSGQEALAAFASQRPDLIILDLGLPDMDGLDVMRLLRESSQVPVIILSVREREADKIAALDAGADDYLTKPFGTGELLARIRVVMRRPFQAVGGSVFRVDDLTVDLARRRITMGDSEVQLSPTEYDLLQKLVLQAGRVLTHHHLLREVWGPGYDGELHLLRVTVSNLRRKLEPDPTRPHYILTEPGVGYRLRVNP